MMKKAVLSALVLFAVLGKAFCEEIVYVVTQDTQLRQGAY